MLQKLDSTENSAVETGKPLFDAQGEERGRQWLDQWSDQLSPRHDRHGDQQGHGNDQAQSGVIEVNHPVKEPRDQQSAK